MYGTLRAIRVLVYEIHLMPQFQKSELKRNFKCTIGLDSPKNESYTADRGV
jgi:hypothetical protein